MKQKLVLIKLGGASLKEEKIIREMIEAIRNYRKYGYSVVLVHGGGPFINEALTSKAIEWTFINGQRKTTPAMMETIEDVLFNQVNKFLVEKLNECNVPALGINGSENEMLFCVQANKELEQVGSIEKVNTLWIERLLSVSGEVVPVIAPIGIGSDGKKYNINADWAASKIAVALRAEQLVFLTDQKGILNDSKELIPYATVENLNNMIENGVVTGGMYTKVLTVIQALKAGVPTVRIMSGIDAGKGLWSDYIGTVSKSEVVENVYA